MFYTLYITARRPHTQPPTTPAKVHKNILTRAYGSHIFNTQAATGTPPTGCKGTKATARPTHRQPKQRTKDGERHGKRPQNARRKAVFQVSKDGLSHCKQTPPSTLPPITQTGRKQRGHNITGRKSYRFQKPQHAAMSFFINTFARFLTLTHKTHARNKTDVK